MGTLVLLLIAVQVLGSLAHSPPQPPPPPPPPGLLLAPGCNNSRVETAAELALDRINAHQKQGYVLGLQRIFDAHERPRGPTGSIFYLTLDVLETRCHVLSRKLWKDCEFRASHETVYGQCKATVLANRTGGVSRLYSYDCVLRPISARDIVRGCPDCPVPSDPTAPEFLEAATESLAKFNAEVNHIHYFALLNVTKARFQWVVGPARFVEYIIQETSCSKSKGTEDISKCPLLPPEVGATGLCKGSVVNSQIEHEKFVRAECELYPPQPPVTDQQHQQHGEKPGQGHQHVGESHEGDHHHHGHHGDHQHLPHHSQEHRCPLEPVGRVIVLPRSSTHVSLHSLPEPESEQLDGKPVVPEKKQPKVTNGHPDRNGAPQEGRRPGIPPFPTEFSESDTCPGEIREHIFGLELPKGPAVKLPAAATKH